MRNIQHTSGLVLLGAFIFMTGSMPCHAAGKTFRHETPPDLTRGGQPDDTRDWRLGPLGANGWVFNRNRGRWWEIRLGQGIGADGKRALSDCARLQRSAHTPVPVRLKSPRRFPTVSSH